MPRTDVPISNLAAGVTIRPAATTADTTNDHVIGPLTFPLEELVIEITQTDATARVATILAGDSPPALSAGQGDLSQSMAQNAVYYFAGLESARFLHNDGTVQIDLAASFAGSLRAYRVPR
jgi:hypothetical protein